MAWEKKKSLLNLNTFPVIPHWKTYKPTEKNIICPTLALNTKKAM